MDGLYSNFILTATPARTRANAERRMERGDLNANSQYHVRCCGCCYGNYGNYVIHYGQLFDEFICA